MRLKPFFQHSNIPSSRMFWLLSALLVALCLPVEAQQPKEARIAVIGAPEEPRFSEVVAGLKNGLTELGYVAPSLIVQEH
jgi:ABC-type uncharacterized transport system substrate-binding protein